MRTLRAVLARLAGSFGRAEGASASWPPRSRATCRCTSTTTSARACPPEEARRQAVLKLGGVEATKEACRERAGLPFVEHFSQDLRFAARQLSRNPAFAATAVGVLALGIGASGALFAFVDAALIQPLPYRAPSRLSASRRRSPPTRSVAPPSPTPTISTGSGTSGASNPSTPTGAGHLLATPAGAEAVFGARVTAGFFRTLASPRRSAATSSPARTRPARRKS